MSKISNIISKNLSNLSTAVDNFSNDVSSMFNSAQNSQQTNAAAAKILNKSPLEIDDTSQTAHMKQNPY